MHVAADFCAQAVDDLIQGLGAAGVHADEELVLVFHPRRAGLNVRQVDALVLQFTETNGFRWDLSSYLLMFLKSLMLLFNLFSYLACPYPRKEIHFV